MSGERHKNQIRDALRVLIDPDLPWVHADENPNCGQCWECIAGTLGIARVMRRNRLDVVTNALMVEDRLVWLCSRLNEAQDSRIELSAAIHAEHELHHVGPFVLCPYKTCALASAIVNAANRHPLPLDSGDSAQ